MLTSTLFRRALVALLLAVPLVATGGTAQAAACSGSSDVTVIVQFPDGHTQSGCASGDPSSGTQALKSAGFSYTYAQGQAFVCTINNAPKATCGRTPPANAYWAYFHANRGGKWAYSSQGAASSNPAPGSVEGWRFGSGAQPSTPPPAAAPAPKPRPKPKPKPKPTPSARPTAASTPAATASASASATKSAAAKKSAKPATSATPAKKAKDAATKPKAKKPKKAAAAPKASTSTSPSSEPSEAVVSAPVRTSAEPTGGSGRSWLWGVAALVVVGGAAGAVTVVRRR